MTKPAAFVLMLALPGLVAADFYRLRPSSVIDPPDALTWNTRMQRPEPAAVHSDLLSLASFTASIQPSSCRSRVACPGVAPHYLGRCLSQPECRSHVNAPILWLHTPRVDEQRTSEKEPRLSEVRERHSTDQ